MTEEEVVLAWDKLKEGDKSVVPLLWSHFYPLVISSFSVKSWILSPEEMQDVKHDAAAQVLRKVLGRPELIRFEEEGRVNKYTTIRKYLVKATKNQAINLSKKRGRFSKDDPYNPEINYSGKGNKTDEEIEDERNRQSEEEQYNWLFNTIEHKLPEQWKTVVLLRLANTPFRDIATTLGISQDAAESRYRRALKKLRRLAEKKFDLSDE